ncbi:beta-propeller domain-containing protein [Nocardioides sp. GY 10113]|uniref:beta-propeller domain-containing protein n=1 Tax=Nocardioides sp. GY 10113 TaxID=2569761 RepID=UPI001458EF6D|nr:beta-propeller domain-containing protein [Nocardioides sp. GY 10113]
MGTFGTPVRRWARRPRSAIAAAVAVTVAGAFAVGWWAGGGPAEGAGRRTGVGPGSAPAPAPSPVAFAADLTPEASCEDLLARYVDRALRRVTARGWRTDRRPYGPFWTADDGVTGAARVQKQLSSAPATTRQRSSATGTNVQEMAVDEPDAVKTDGALLVRVRGEELVVYDVSGPRVVERGGLLLPGVEEPELLLAGDTVVALGADTRSPRADDGSHRGSRVLTVDVSDPAHPAVVDDVAYGAELVSARQHGTGADVAVRLVLSAGLPDLDFRHPGRRLRAKAALDANRRLVERTTIEDWLPTMTTAAGTDGEDGARPLLECTDVAVPTSAVALGTVAVVGFRPDDPTDVDAVGLAGATDVAYESADHLYLAASPPSTPWGWMWEGDCAAGACGSSDDGTSYLFDFALDGTRARHVASGDVEGRIADRWSMDEAGGVLRVAVEPTQETGDFTSVVTLRRSGGRLAEVGRLDRLGVGEDLKAVRWFDDVALLVTFRRIDPLYAVDLSDVSHPRKLGELKIPGFSAYLHPLGPHRLIGVGSGPGEGRRWGAQAGLFAVTDLTDPRRLDVRSFGTGTEAVAGEDPRAFTWVQEHRTALAVVQRWRRTRTADLVVLRVAGGRLHPETTTRVEYGDDVDLVRTVPVGGGRVVLVTGEDVRFLDL